MTAFRSRSTALAAAMLTIAVSSALPAQTPVTFPPIDFSGTIFGNYNYQKAPVDNVNFFDVQRVYLTFRMPAGDRASIRVTTDIFQQTNAANAAFYAGWVLRFKYAWLQYNYLNSNGWAGLARIGFLHTVVIDYVEQFWPRWISQTALERAGYFSSADAGLATLVTLPGKWGEIYGVVTNGPGYTSRELDRFKDPQIRLTLTPLANTKAGILTSFAISPWYYKGDFASRFVNGGAGQIGPQGYGLERNRAGIFVGIRDPRLTIGGEFAERRDAGETGANTVASPAVVVDSTGRLTSGFALIRPLAFADTSLWRLSLFGRYDHVTTNTADDGAYHVVIGGLMWDLTRRMSVSVNYQEQLTNTLPTVPAGGAVVLPTQPSRVYYFQFLANF